ncbi:Retrovirus-related Pol polyprotein from transposon TNT 1-94 [Porphyridium purpureum]|uniref:Retrovirus-related Pol polyprotein from transposon TNT 1-94 n=1 Tax=Porphyridium purpureum TaxID=35688 RepID=A0A5J4YJH2_PORPP|nr:Retrovirus-related Pol polyprotein from transposon TNT 1-94 [Porphyridium purpureum]|eukprot:POR6467..scf255_21
MEYDMDRAAGASTPATPSPARGGANASATRLGAAASARRESAREETKREMAAMLNAAYAQMHRQLSEEFGAKMATELNTRTAIVQSELAELRSENVRLRALRDGSGGSGALPSCMRPAAMLYYGGERSTAAIMTWTAAARSRVYNPARSDWRSQGRLWTETEEEEAVSTLSTHLFGLAQLWYQALQPDQRPTSVEEFLLALQRRFEPKETENDVRDELQKMKQGAMSVQDFEAAFSEVCLRIPNLVDKDKLHYFTESLDTSIATHVALHFPPTYDDALRLALVADKVIFKRGRDQQPITARTYPSAMQPAYHPQMNYNQHGPVPMDLGTASGSSARVHERGYNDFQRDRSNEYQQQQHDQWSPAGPHRNLRANHAERYAQSRADGRDGGWREPSTHGWNRGGGQNDARGRGQKRGAPQRGGASRPRPRQTPKSQQDGKKSNQRGRYYCHRCSVWGPATHNCADRRDDRDANLGGAELMTASAGKGLLKVNAWVNGRAMKAVIDTGATHTFLSESACAMVRVRTNSTANALTIRLADGTQCMSRGRATVNLAVLDSAEKQQDVVVYNGHNDLVIGLDWLRANRFEMTFGGHSLGTAEAEHVEQDHCVLHMPSRDTCGICSAAKLRRARAVRRDDSVGKERGRAREFNDVVSIDIVDPGLAAVDGSRWLLTHLDEATGWFSAIGLADKSAAECIRGLTELQRGRGDWPRVLRCDEGREFMGEFDGFIAEKGVKKVTGVPYRANTHATHERKHADLNGAVRALLMQSGLPTAWYPFAAAYFCLARNLAWRGAKQEQTSFEQRLGLTWHKPIPAFGSGILIYDESRGKFEPKGLPAIVVGFTAPRPNDPRQPINLLALPIADLRPSAIRKVGEWKPLPDKWPLRRLALRPPDEAIATGDQWSRARDNAPDRAFCTQCKKIVGGSTECEKCILGPAPSRRHTGDGACRQMHCQCYRDEHGKLASRAQYRRIELPWSPAEDIAISEGIARFGEDWLAIAGRPAFFMRGRKPAGLRARAAELGVLPVHAAAASDATRNDATRAESSSNATYTSAATGGPEDEAAGLGVAEVVATAVAMATPAGRHALASELRALTSTGALPFRRTMDKAVAARVPNAQFVKLKLLFNKKNSEMPPSFHKTKCRIVAQGCVVLDADGRRAREEPYPFDRPPGLLAIRASMSMALMLHGPSADGAFFDVTCAYPSAPLGGRPTFGYLRDLVPVVKGLVSEADYRKMAACSEPVVELPQALYGMKRSGSDFSHDARERVRRLGWQESNADKNQYWRRDANGSMLTLSMYVDDGALFGNADAVRVAVKQLKTVFRIDQKVEYIADSARTRPIKYLGMHIYRDGGRWILDSGVYATHVANGHTADNLRVRSTPLSERVDDNGPGGRACPTNKRTVIGQLLWLSRTTRADIAYATAHVARYVDRWGPSADRALDEIVGYLKKHADVCLQYDIPATGSRDVRLHAWADADFSAPSSTSGAVLFISNGRCRHLVDWTSRRQRRVSTSTTEAELVALHDAAQGSVFPVATLAEELLRRWPPIVVRCDNESTLRAVERGHSDRLLHAPKMQRISLRWLHEIAADGLVRFVYVATRDNIADGLTKPIATDVFRGHAAAWGLYGASSSLGIAQRLTHARSAANRGNAFAMLMQPDDCDDGAGMRGYAYSHDDEKMSCDNDPYTRWHLVERV